MRIAVLADLHHYSETLGTDGKAYTLRAENDQKCLKETGAIIDAAFSRLIEEKPDAVLIAGDITNDGERVSHDEIHEKLCRLNETVPVFLTTATHDWCCDGHAKRFCGDEILHETDTLSPTECRTRYAEFGKDHILSAYRTHLDKSSYCYQLSENVRLLAIDDDQDGKGHAGYSDAHLSWITEQAAQAKQDGAVVIAMQHHLLLPGLIPLINNGQMIGEADSRAETLADAGLHLLFVGHSHMQRITKFTSKNGNTITQVNVGSLCGYPAPIVCLDIDGTQADIHTETLQSFSYNGKPCSSDTLKAQTLGVLTGLLSAAEENEQALEDRLRSHGIRFGALHTVYPVIRTLAQKLQTCTVGQAANLVNRLTFGHGIRKRYAESVKNELLLPYIYAVFLCVFDGSESAAIFSEDAKQVAFDVAALPEAVVSHLPIPKKIKQVIHLITEQIELLMYKLLLPDGDHRNTHTEL